MSRMNLFGGLAYAVMKLGIMEHYISIRRGVVDTRDLVYFISLIALFILLTRISLESRKW